MSRKEHIHNSCQIVLTSPVYCGLGLTAVLMSTKIMCRAINEHYNESMIDNCSSAILKRISDNFGSSNMKFGPVVF